MMDAQRIARLEMVVAILIGWLARELGVEAASKLLDMLQDDATPPTKGDTP